MFVLNQSLNVFTKAAPYYGQTIFSSSQRNFLLQVKNFFKPKYFFLSRVTQPLGWLDRKQSPVRRLIWLWHAAYWAKS